MTGSVVAIDVGGTTIKGARYDSDDSCVERRSVATPSTPSAGVDSITAMAEALLTGDTVSIGVVVPGLVDETAGVVRYAANLGWRDLALRTLLASRLPRPIVLGHDVSAAAAAEAAAGLGYGSLLYVSIGTGIAVGLVQDGRVWRGSTGQAGELGHTCAVPGGEVCACGQRGCVEAYASGAAISRRYRAGVGRAAHRHGDDPAIDAVGVVARKSDDLVAARVWNDAVVALGTGLAATVLLFDPSVVVLGGGVSTAGPALIDPLRRDLDRRLVWRSTPPIRVGRWGIDAGLRGAAMLARNAAVDVREGARV